MARLREEYNKTLKKELAKELGLTNLIEVPTLKKIVINVQLEEEGTIVFTFIRRITVKKKLMLGCLF